jgi:Lrp/AsnC family leucine-responsive transcriptional regulator
MVTLDNKDKKILEIINNDARLSVAEISRKTGIQRDSVLYRINKMKKQNVIRFFHTVIDPTVLNHPVYSFVNFVLYNLTEEKEKSFQRYLKSNPNVVYVAKTTGKWDVVIAIAARDLKQFDEIMTGIRMKFSKIIKEYDSSSIIQEYKYDNMTGLI